MLTEESNPWSPVTVCYNVCSLTHSLSLTISSSSSSTFASFLFPFLVSKVTKFNTCKVFKQSGAGLSDLEFMCMSHSFKYMYVYLAQSGNPTCFVHHVRVCINECHLVSFQFIACCTCNIQRVFLVWYKCEVGHLYLQWWYMQSLVYVYNSCTESEFQVTQGINGIELQLGQISLKLTIGQKLVISKDVIRIFDCICRIR